MDISTRSSRVLVQDDQTWLGNGGEPIGKPRSIVLDRDLFNLVSDNFNDGYIPSGIILGKVTATGLYGPYKGPMNEVQTVNLGAASAGTGTITVVGETTGNVDFDASVAEIQAAIDALIGVDPGDIVVSGGPWPTTNITLTYEGKFAGLNVAQVTVDGTNLTGETITAATSQAGGAAASADGREAAAGHLFTAVAYDRTSSGDMGAALFWSGEVIEDNLPTGHGLDSAARTALKHISYV